MSRPLRLATDPVPAQLGQDSDGDGRPGGVAGRAREADLPVGLAQASLGFLLGSLGPYLLLLATELEREPGQLAWLSSAFGIGLVLAAVAGPVVLRLGAGAVLRLAGLFLAAGATLAATAPGLPVASIGVLLIGLASAAIVLTSPVLLAGADAAARLTRTTAAASCGSITAPLLVAAIEHLGGSGRLGLLAPLPVLLALVAGPTARTSAPTTMDVPAPRPRPAAAKLAAGWVMIVLAVAAEFCFLIWGTARVHAAGASVATAAVLGSAFLVGMAVGRLGGGWLVARLPMVTVGCLTALAGTATVFLFPAPVPVAAGLGLAGLGIAVLYPVALARLSAVPGLSRNHAAALGALASGVAILAAPTLLAAVTSQVSLRLAFLLPAAFLLALLALAHVHHLRRSSLGRQAS